LIRARGSTGRRNRVLLNDGSGVGRSPDWLKFKNPNAPGGESVVSVNVRHGPRVASIRRMGSRPDTLRRTHRKRI
jgi:hypothetical protein